MTPRLRKQRRRADRQLPAPAPFYEIRFTADAEGESTVVDLVRPLGEEARRGRRKDRSCLGAARRAKVAALAKRLKPFPTAGDQLGHHRFAGRSPTTRLRTSSLFTVESAGEAVPQGLADWEPVVFQAKGKTPWTLEQTSLFYSPSNGMLQRGIEIVKLPGGMAADVRSGESLAAAARASRGERCSSHCSRQQRYSSRRA